MDAEYYFLGGKYLAQNEISAPFLWNYLDDPIGLPHPLFSYWKPLASILAAIPMKIFGTVDFQIGRSLFYLIASLIPSLAVFIGYQITQNKFLSYLSGFFALFSGFYFKFVTIPETITPYLLLGSLYFFTAYRIIQTFHKKDRLLWLRIFVLGVLSGLMALTRVDGLLYLGFSFLLIGFLTFKTFGKTKGQMIKLAGLNSLWFLLGFILMMLPDYLINDLNFGSIFSPVGLKAIWINSYDDTFIYPASELNFKYWLAAGGAEKIRNIWDAFLLNLGTLAAVQLNIFGIPLFVMGAWRYKRETWLKFFLFISISLFLFMTLLFPLAGSRGGYLHAGASLQVINWVLISIGFYEFLLWGIRKRNWALNRAQIMFGSALILFSIILTISIYYQDVISSETQTFSWNQVYDQYSQIEKIIHEHALGKEGIVMINNPVGFHYQTGRWTIILPNAEQEKFEEVITKFNVSYLVLDPNVPIRMYDYFDSINGITEIGKIPTIETTIYEINR